jgi:hypothetical protein
MNWNSFTFLAPDGWETKLNHLFDRPFWKSADEYTPILRYPFQGIAWEFLRRNPDYFTSFHSWKYARSIANGARVGKSDPVWADEARQHQELCSRFGLDPIWGPVPPDKPYPTIPRFIDEPVRQISEFPMGSIAAIRELSDNELAAITCRGIIKKFDGKINLRHQLVIYIRLLDAKASGSPLRRTCAFVYGGIEAHTARQTYNNHWRAAKQMALSGYRRLAARPWNASNFDVKSTGDFSW